MPPATEPAPPPMNIRPGYITLVKSSVLLKSMVARPAVRPETELNKAFTPRSAKPKVPRVSSRVSSARNKAPAPKAHRNRLVTTEVPLPNKLGLVAFIPDFDMPTSEARTLLAPTVPRTDAVYNVGRTALLVAALAQSDLDLLRVATQDRLHQPQRQAVFPAMKNLINAALGAGAHGAMLSGSGSTVLAFTSEKEMTVGYEMSEAAAKSGVQGDVKVMRPSVLGACLA